MGDCLDQGNCLKQGEKTEENDESSRTAIFLEGMNKIFLSCKEQMDNPELSSPDQMENLFISIVNQYLPINKLKQDDSSDLCPIEDLLNVRLKMSSMLKSMGINSPFVDEFCNISELEKFYRQAEKGNHSIGDMLDIYANNINFASQDQKEFMTRIMKKLYIDSSDQTELEPEQSSD